MDLMFYSGNPKNQPKDRPELPRHRAEREKLDAPEGYIADDGLREAVNVALLLGQPLLLTGDPGTGKTLLASSLAHERDLGYEKFVTKSSSTAKDLFYTYDTLARFHSAQAEENPRDPIEFLTYRALGTAIIRSNPDNIPPEVRPAWLAPDAEPCRTVVLIDEVDKAPRDFPNDILNEIDNLFFTVPEIGSIEVEADKDYSPIVVITSNSERSLPDAFLRRCIFHHIEFPENSEKLLEIIDSRLPALGSSHTELLDSAVEFFMLLRKAETGLEKKPGTAELLNWLAALAGKRYPPDWGIEKDRDFVETTLGALLKTVSDLRVGKDALKNRFRT